MKPGSYIELTFDGVYVQSKYPECNEDYIVINDVSVGGNIRVIDKLCNVRPPKGAFYSSWNKMQVILHADDATTGSGFKADYTSRTFQLSERMRMDIQFDGIYEL